MFESFAKEYEKSRGRLSESHAFARDEEATYALLRCECEKISMTPNDTGLFNCKCRHSGMGKMDSNITNMKIREIQAWQD